MSEETKMDDKKIDYLEVDNIIPGQNYVCLSFLSPESLIQNREAFNCSKFLQSYCKDKNLKFEEVYESYMGFVYKHEDKLQRDFDEKNNFQTSLRGIKVRGVFDTRDAAESQAKKLSLTDSSHHVYIGQVGYWLPWEPNADKVQDEIFQNSQLNNMMEKYQENTINKDMFYEEQKREKIKEAKEEYLKNKRENEKKEREAKELLDKCDNCPEKSCSDCSEIKFGMEPEVESNGSITGISAPTGTVIQSELDPEVEPEVVDSEPEPEVVDSEPEPEPEVVDSEPEPEVVDSEPEPEVVDSEPKPEPEVVDSEPAVKTVNVVDESLKESLVGEDPWMKQKLNKTE